MKKSVDALGAAHLATLQAHMEAAAETAGRRSRSSSPSPTWRRRRPRSSPRPTAKVKADGYSGYSQIHRPPCPAERKAKYPYAGELSNTTELQLLCNGKHSVLDIKALLDAQSQRKSTVKGIMNYLQILKLAGLVEF